MRQSPSSLSEGMEGKQQMHGRVVESGGWKIIHAKLPTFCSTDGFTSDWKSLTNVFCCYNNSLVVSFERIF